MSAWKAFYEGREGHDYLEYAKVRYRPHIQAILQRIQVCDDVLEIGVGTGTITKALIDVTTRQARDVIFFGLDNDKEMVKIAQERLGDDATIYISDVFKSVVGRPEVVHSHGLLEHFCDEDIRKIIANYSSARAQIHYVPGMYKEPTFGDERLMPVEKWWEIAKPDQIITFNEGLDYVIIIDKEWRHAFPG